MLFLSNPFLPRVLYKSYLDPWHLRITGDLIIENYKIFASVVGFD